jgi:hypothetical protein
LFGADGGYDTAFLTPLPASSVTTIVYLRTHFNYSGTTAGAVLTGRLYIDDGCVIYINGVEVFRENITDNPVIHTTVAPVANPRNEPVQFNFEVDLSTKLTPVLARGTPISASGDFRGSG